MKGTAQVTKEHSNAPKSIRLSPAFKQNNISVALSSSNYYAPYAGVFLKSLLRYSTSEHNYDIIIFTKDMSEENERLLLGIVGGKANVSLRFVKIQPYLDGFALNTHAHFGVESYFRLLVPFMLTGYNKVFYFDCDMVLRDDVALLNGIDIGDNYLAGSHDIAVVGAINHPEDNLGWKRTAIEKLFMQDPYRYINSGVLIFNLIKIRTDFTPEYMLDFALKKQFFLLDQDSLNALCQPYVIILEQAWNMTSDVGGSKISLIQDAPFTLYDDYMYARSHTKTVHYADRFKPWKYPLEDLGFEFWVDAKQTAYYERILYQTCSDLCDRAILEISITQPCMMEPGLKKELKLYFKQTSALLLPYGSWRRRILKKIYFALRGWGDTN